MKAVWKENDEKSYPKLEKNISREVVVVGGGICGFLTAYFLAEKGKKVTLLEADRLFCGTTLHTTAKVTLNHGDTLLSIEKAHGDEGVRRYCEGQREAIEAFKSLIALHKIHCEFEEVDSYIYSLSNKSKILKIYKVLLKAGIDVEYVEDICIGKLRAKYGVRVKKQFQFNPIAFLKGLPVKFEIFEHTRVSDIDANSMTLVSEKNKIKAEKIIFCCHYPILNKVGFYTFRMYQSLSYTIAIPRQDFEGIFLQDKGDGLSFRNYGDYTIVGGFDHRSGRNNSQSNFEKLEKSVQEIFECEPILKWAAEDCMTFDGLPFAGRYSIFYNNIYVATGFNKWGMTNSMVCSQVLCDLICDKENKLANLLSPSRKQKGSLNEFLINAWVNVKNIFLGLFRWLNRDNFDKVPTGFGKVMRYRGKKVAVYKDENGELFIIQADCPHLHGELKWNNDTKSWDCPCHGSRFDIYGNILNEPSTKKCESFKK